METLKTLNANNGVIFLHIVYIRLSFRCYEMNYNFSYLVKKKILKTQLKLSYSRNIVLKKKKHLLHNLK